MNWPRSWLMRWNIRSERKYFRATQREFSLYSSRTTQRGEIHSKQISDNSEIDNQVSASMVQRKMYHQNMGHFLWKCTLAFLMLLWLLERIHITNQMKSPYKASKLKKQENICDVMGMWWRCIFRELYQRGITRGSQYVIGPKWNVRYHNIEIRMASCWWKYNSVVSIVFMFVSYSIYNIK